MSGDKKNKNTSRMLKKEVSAILKEQKSEKKQNRSLSIAMQKQQKKEASISSKTNKAIKKYE